MLVSLYMSRDPVTVGPDDDISEASRLMARHGVRCLPVVDRGRTTGMLSRTDLLRALPDGRHPFSAEVRARSVFGVRVGDVMTGHIVTVRSGDSIDRAVTLLDDHKLSVVAVVDDGRLVGMLSRSDILRAFREIVFAPSATRISLLVPRGVDLIGRLLAHHRFCDLHLRAYTEHRYGDERLVEIALEGEERTIDDVLGRAWGGGVRVLTRRDPVRVG